MGSLFSQSVPRYSPVSYAPQTQSTTDAPSQNDKLTVQQNNQNAAEEDSLKDVIRRSSRGRNSLIQTSYRGVLTDVSSLAPQRKNLLGE